MLLWKGDIQCQWTLYPYCFPLVKYTPWLHINTGKWLGNQDGDFYHGLLNLCSWSQYIRKASPRKEGRRESLLSSLGPVFNYCNESSLIWYCLFWSRVPVQEEAGQLHWQSCLKRKGGRVGIIKDHKGFMYCWDKGRTMWVVAHWRNACLHLEVRRALSAFRSKRVMDKQVCMKNMFFY